MVCVTCNLPFFEKKFRFVIPYHRLSSLLLCDFFFLFLFFDIFSFHRFFLFFCNFLKIFSVALPFRILSYAIFIFLSIVFFSSFVILFLSFTSSFSFFTYFLYFLNCYFVQDCVSNIKDREKKSLGY